MLFFIIGIFEIREFPPTVHRKLWQPYFQKTFDAFTQVCCNPFKLCYDLCVAVEVSTRSSSMCLRGFELLDLVIRLGRSRACIIR